jgi:diguanylate cyclase (GGDEF)-like protein
MSRPMVALSLPVLRSYGLVLLTTGLSFGLWLLLGDQLVPSPFLLFTAAVAVSAWYGGLGPAITGIGMSTLACLVLYTLPNDPENFSPEQEVLYLLVFLLVSLLIAALQVARQRAEAALAQQAFYDSLTRLPNRRLVADRLEQALRTAHRQQDSCAVLLLDLDGFKEVNDSLGHHQGDLVLQKVSRHLETGIRESDTVGRWGGDEFALVLPYTALGGAILTAERLLQQLSEPILLDSQRVRISGSIGIALYPDHGRDIEALLQEADAAMYRCKRAGGGRYGLPEEAIGSTDGADHHSDSA